MIPYDFEISVRKITDEELLREACSMTFNGTSNANLLTLYKAEHSPVRTQLFWATFTHIPLFIATHLLRHHVGSTPFQLTCRDDRDGGNPGLKGKIKQIKDLLHGSSDIEGAEILLDNLFTSCDRYTPVNLGLFINAQSVIDMSKLRLCTQAHVETREVYHRFKEELKKVDPDLASMMVRKCVYRGGICGEMRCCGYNSTSAFQSELAEYLSHFKAVQKGPWKELFES